MPRLQVSLSLRLSVSRVLVPEKQNANDQQTTINEQHFLGHPCLAGRRASSVQENRMPTINEQQSTNNNSSVLPASPADGRLRSSVVRRPSSVVRPEKQKANDQRTTINEQQFIRPPCLAGGGVFGPKAEANKQQSTKQHSSVLPVSPADGRLRSRKAECQQSTINKQRTTFPPSLRLKSPRSRKAECQRSTINNQRTTFPQSLRPQSLRLKPVLAGVLVRP